MEIAQSGLEMGRPIVAPPGVDPAKVEILRKAFNAVFKDPEYVAECEKQRLNCTTPSSAAGLQAIIERIYASPGPAVAKISAIYMEGQK